MDFARCQLEKYGWKVGEGLGKHKSGISAPIKAKIKNDKCGLGVNANADIESKWWEKTFNSAASKIEVQNSKDGVELKSEQPKSSRKRHKETLTYGIFKKTSRLDAAGTEERLVPEGCEERVNEPFEQHLTDEQLFKACGGRTAHKSARHGSGLSGKLARVEKQEGILQTQPSSSTSSKPKESRKPAKKKKIKKH